MTNSPPDDEDVRSRSNWVVLVVAVLIVAVGFLVIHEIVRFTRLSDCELAGHHDCEPVDAQGSR